MRRGRSRRRPSRCSGPGRGACGGRPRRSPAASRGSGGAVSSSPVKPSVCSSASTPSRVRSGRTRRTFASAPSVSIPSRRAAISPSATDAASPAGEHQRRDAVAGLEAVGAAAAALALDRDAEVAQGDDVAPDRADVDAEPPRELRARRRRAVLERLEQREHAVGLAISGEALRRRRAGRRERRAGRVGSVRIRGQILPCLSRTVQAMAHEPRQITFLGRDGQTKHYGIATHGPLPSPELAEATRALAEPGVARLHDRPRGQGGGDGARLLVGGRRTSCTAARTRRRCRWATPASCRR